MESPFARYLHTNRVPTAAEMQDICAHLVPFEEDLLRLVSIRDPPASLQNRRAMVEKYIHAHKALGSPAHRLPPELIGQIFLHCLPHRSNALMRTSEAPLLLCRICSVWRAVALSLPRLW
ncbi:hypothetical protein GGX14DRAFT_315439, partial [Mycena pura]